MEDLTPRQRQVLQTILAYQLRQSCPPTIRQLTDELGLASPNGIAGHLRALKLKGYLQEGEGRYGVLRLAAVEWIPLFDGTQPAGVLLAELYRELTATATALFTLPPAAVLPQDDLSGVSP